jgi:flagellar basal body-associated protein FliL
MKKKAHIKRSNNPHKQKSISKLNIRGYMLKKIAILTVLVIITIALSVYAYFFSQISKQTPKEVSKPQIKIDTKNSAPQTEQSRTGKVSDVSNSSITISAAGQIYTYTITDTTIFQQLSDKAQISLSAIKAGEEIKVLSKTGKAINILKL